MTAHPAKFLAAPAVVPQHSQKETEWLTAYPVPTGTAQELADLPDAEFYGPWHARLHASNGKPQSVQDRVMDRFFAACRARDEAKRAAASAAEVAAKRAHHAAEMRDYRARRSGRLAGQRSDQ